MSHRIYGDGRDAMLMICVDGFEVFGCTLAPVAEESRAWLAQHIDDAFQRCAAGAAKKAVAQHNADLRKLLDIR